MNCRVCFILAACVAVAVAENVNCWGAGADCRPTVTRFDRLRVHTLLIRPETTGDQTTATVLFSGVHFPNVDGQPPGRLVQLQFRGSFSQITGCACPNGNCETLVKSCACASGTTCTVDQVRACVDAWMPLVCTGTPTPPISQFSEQTFLQISFGRNNYMTNISQSADGAIGLPGYVFLNPSVPETPDPTPSRRNYAFANNKALTALVQINQGNFVYAEWNWDKADTRCNSPEKRGTRRYPNNIFNPCGRETDNPCINNLVCAVTFDYCLLSMMRANTAANPGVVSPECDLVISLAWQGTDANRRFCASQNQMFSKFNALGLDNLIQATLTRGSDITSDIESKLRG